ncbi:MAG: arginine--tRNA ligase [Eubacteriales bacterium]|nr:arginine--tRNA ligase [Eubacteriales bacterium]MDD4286204.1 arginine--tRNA ligase [Eubacteriales bacterium]
MLSIKKEIARILQRQLQDMSVEEIENSIEIPTDSSMGDYAFPCFRLAKALRKPPHVIAGELASSIGDNELFARTEAVKAYVNMFIDGQWLARITLEDVCGAGDDFGRSDIGAGRPVIVEFSSPNIAKPFHIGHIRTTVIGNAIYKIFDFLGYKTIRINHLGDYGTQFGKMIVAYRHWGKREDVEAAPISTLLSYYVKFHEEVEKDPSLDDEAREVFSKLEHQAPEETALWQWFRDESLKEFSRVYEMLDIEFDSFAGESFYSDKMPAVLEEMEAKGILKDSQGAKIVDLEEYGMPPALITKTDGSSLYITRDIAAAIYRKKTYDFFKNIYVVGAQQNLHFQQWFKILELMGHEWHDQCVHINFGTVSLAEGTLSTRKGRVVFLEDVLNKAVEQTRQVIRDKNVNTDSIEETAKMVGIGAVIFQELSNGRIKDYTFSWEKTLNFDGETGPYVQYTHARAASVLRNGGWTSPPDIDAVDLAYLAEDSAFALLKMIYRFPEVVLDAGEKYEPSLITRHIVDVAQAFNKFYHDEHILTENAREKEAKLLLTYAAKQTIKNGLGLLGIQAPEKM